MQPTSVAAFLENMVKDSKRRLAIAITIVFSAFNPLFTKLKLRWIKNFFFWKVGSLLSMNLNMNTKNSKYVMLSVGSSGSVGNSVVF